MRVWNTVHGKRLLLFSRSPYAQDASAKEVIPSTALWHGWAERKHFGKKFSPAFRSDTRDISKCSAARAGCCSTSRPETILRCSTISTETLSICTGVCGSSRRSSAESCGICSTPALILNI